MPELPEELVEKAAKAHNDGWAANPSHGAFWEQLEPHEHEWNREAVRVAFDAIGLSSILRERDEAVAKAEATRQAWEVRGRRIVQLEAEVARLSGGPVAATPPTGNDGQDDREALRRDRDFFARREADKNVELDLLRSRLEAAEGERDAWKREALMSDDEGENVGRRARRWHEEAEYLSDKLAMVKGERDRLLSAERWIVRNLGGQRLQIIEGPTFPVGVKVELLNLGPTFARAALSTGDRQDDDSHVRTAEATQPEQARHETGGGST